MSSSSPNPTGDAIRYTRPQLLRLSRSPKVAQAGQLVLSSALEGGVRMPRFKEWFGDLPPPSPPQSRPSPNSPPATRARSSRNGGEGSSSTAGASGRDRDRDRPPHHTADKAAGAAVAVGSSGGMGAFRHSSTRGEKRGERGLVRDEGEEKGGLRKMAESFDRGERVPKSWGARASDATKDADRDTDKDSAPSSGRERDRDDSNWGKGDWRSRAAGLPSKPTLPSGSSSSILASSSSNGLREGGGGGRTAPGRPAWNPAPAVGSLDDRPARERGDRNDRGDRRRRGGDDDDETPAWMRAEAGSDGLEKGGSRKGRTRTGDDTEAFGGGGGLGGSRRREEKAGPAPSPAGDDKRDGEDAIMRFKREMRERDGLSAPPQESATSTTTPAATESAKPVSTGMFDHLTRPPPKTANSAPLLPPSSAPGSGLFRDPAILSSPAASPSIASASVVGTVGGQKRAPGGSRFAKFFTEEPKKTPAGAPAPAQQMASPPMGGQASPQVGNLMSILAGGGGSPIPSQQQQQHSQQRPVEENDQMNKLLAMLQSSHAPEPSHTRSHMPPLQPQTHLDLSALSLGGRPPASLPPQLQQHQHQQRSRPASPAFAHQQHQTAAGRSPLYPPSMGGDRSLYDHPALPTAEPSRRQERDHLQVLLDAQAQQRRAANSSSPLDGGSGGGGYSIDQLRQLQQMGGGAGGQRMAPPLAQQQQQQHLYRGQSISPPPQGGLPPPNAAEIQNHLLRQMMMGGGGGGGGGALLNGLNGGRGSAGGLSNGGFPPMGPSPPPPPPPQGRQERYLDQLLSSQHGALPPPKQPQQPPYLDPAQMATNPRQQQYIDSLRQQQQQQLQGGYPGLGGMGQGPLPPPPPLQQQQQGSYGGGYPGGYGGPPPQQDLISLLRNGSSGLGRP